MDAESRENPAKAEGYAEETIQQRFYRIDKFYRWLWNDQEGYTQSFTEDDCDRFVKKIAVEDHSNTYKSALAKSLKTLQNYFNWRNNAGYEWEPELNFSSDSGSHNPKDFLANEERILLREASLEYGTIPHYSSLNPKQSSLPADENGTMHRCQARERLTCTPQG